MTPGEHSLRLRQTLPLLEVLSLVEGRATAANLRDDLLPDPDVLLTASVLIITADPAHNDLLVTIRGLVQARLTGYDWRVRAAAEWAAFAVAFGDLLDIDTQAALSLPWAWGAVLARATPDDQSTCA